MLLCNWPFLTCLDAQPIYMTQIKALKLSFTELKPKQGTIA